MALIPIGHVSALKEAGVHYPATPESWRWLYRTRAERGVEEAFLKCGRRILVDTDRLLQLMRQGDVSSGGRRPTGVAPSTPSTTRAGGAR